MKQNTALSFTQFAELSLSVAPWQQKTKRFRIGRGGPAVLWFCIVNEEFAMVCDRLPKWNLDMVSHLLPTSAVTTCGGYRQNLMVS
jgi:hypothetical protein